MSQGSTSLNQKEQLVLSYIGSYLIEDVAALACETFWWGAYGLLFIFALYIQLSKGLTSLLSKGMLAVTILLFASSTTLWALNISALLVRVRARLIDSPSLPLDDRYELGEELIYPLGIPMEALFLLNMLVGDSVVLWRASVLWSGTKKVLILPLILLTGSSVYSVIATTCLAKYGYLTKSALTVGGNPACTWAEPIAWAMSLCTNILSTSLIAWKAWGHRQFIRMNFSERPRKTQAEKALLLLIESGFLYCVFWLLQVVNFIDTAHGIPAYYFSIFVSSMGDQISGLYPTMVIVLVALQQTVEEVTGNNSFSMGLSRGHNIEFARSRSTNGYLSDPPSSMHRPVQMGSFIQVKMKQEVSCSSSVDREPDLSGTVLDIQRVDKV